MNYIVYNTKFVIYNIYLIYIFLNIYLMRRFIDNQIFIKVKMQMFKQKLYLTAIISYMSIICINCDTTISVIMCNRLMKQDIFIQRVK